MTRVSRIHETDLLKRHCTCLWGTAGFETVRASPQAPTQMRRLFAESEFFHSLEGGAGCKETLRVPADRAPNYFHSSTVI